MMTEFYKNIYKNNMTIKSMFYHIEKKQSHMFPIILLFIIIPFVICYGILIFFNPCYLLKVQK